MQQGLDDFEEAVAEVIEAFDFRDADLVEHATQFLVN
jgi:hypothetical protein